jgi:hypothetical protein
LETFPSRSFWRRALMISAGEGEGSGLDIS